MGGYHMPDPVIIKATDSQLQDLLKDPGFSGPSAVNPHHFKTIAQETFTQVEANRQRSPPARRPSDPHNYGGSTSTYCIDGAVPKRFFRHVESSQTEIERSKPRELIPQTVTKEIRNLTNIDIPGTKSNPKDVVRNPRGTDPLNPTYRLPSHVEQGPAPPKNFTKNSLSNDDIEGSKPMPLFPQKMRDPISCRDITNTEPGTAGGLKHLRHDFNVPIRTENMQIDDINLKHKGQLQNLVAEKEAIPEVPGSKPKSIYGMRSDGIDTSLNVSDIPGAKPQSDGRTQMARAKSRQAKAFTQWTGGASPFGCQGTINPPIRQPPEVKAKASRDAPQVLASIAGSADDLKNMYKHFKTIDRESCGKVTSTELEAVLKTTNLSCSGRELKTMMTAYDTDNSGYFNYKAFTRAAKPYFKADKPCPTTPGKPVDLLGNHLGSSAKRTNVVQPTGHGASISNIGYPPDKIVYSMPPSATAEKERQQALFERFERSYSKPAKNRIPRPGSRGSDGWNLIGHPELDQPYSAYWMPTTELKGGFVHGANKEKETLEESGIQEAILQGQQQQSGFSSHSSSPRSQTWAHKAMHTSAFGSTVPLNSGPGKPVGFKRSELDSRPVSAGAVLQATVPPAHLPPRFEKAALGMREREHRQLASDIEAIRGLS